MDSYRAGNTNVFTSLAWLKGLTIQKHGPYGSYRERHMSQASSPSEWETSHYKAPGGGCNVSRSDWEGLGALMSESRMWKLYQQQVSCGQCLSNRTGIFSCEQRIISLCLRESKSLVPLVDLIILNVFSFFFLSEKLS